MYSIGELTQDVILGQKYFSEILFYTKFPTTRYYKFFFFYNPYVWSWRCLKLADYVKYLKKKFFTFIWEKLIQNYEKLGDKIQNFTIFFAVFSSSIKNDVIKISKF